MKKVIYLMLVMNSLLACKQPEKDNSHENTAHSHDEISPAQIKDTLGRKLISSKAYAPEYIQLATNAEIIPDISDAVKTNGVLTHEGVIGPLLFGEKIKSFFIELQPGMFLAEHPHPTESLVYTVSGRWVITSEGKRQVMEPGSVFYFGDNIPTGWEAPFNEKALLYVVKIKMEGENYEPFTKGLMDVKKMMEKEKANGTVFYFNGLKADHPAVVFAKKVNPDFNELLNKLKN
jgi:quercetin dioxygenase-like cupin family protein